MKEFVINKYISLKLEDNQTIIYINKQRFNQCKYILLNSQIDEIEYLLSLESVDELVDNLNKSMEYNRSYIEIPPETEFWAHCSNLQIWVENDYNTRLLHSNLAFPLLKKLVEVGDKKAEKIFREEIAKRIDTKHPTVVAYLNKEGYLDFLPFEYIIDIITDRDLYNIVTREGYELDFTIYLEKIEEKYSHIIKNKVIDIIQNQQLDKLIFLKESGIFDNLKKEDLEYLIANPETKIVNKIFETLKDSEKYVYYYQEGFYFSEKTMKYAHQLISMELAELIKKNDEKAIIRMIRLELPMSIDMDILLPILNDKNINLLNRILDIKFSNKYDIYEFFYNFFNKFNEEISTPLKEYLEMLIANKNYIFIRKFLKNGLLNKLNCNDINHLIRSPKLNFIEIIIDLTKKIDSKESYLLYGSPFNDKLLKYGCQSLKDKFFQVIKKEDEYDIIAMIRLRLIQCLNDVELISLLNKPEINLLECLLKTKKYYSEDVEEWIYSFFKKLEKFLSKSIANIIVDYIKMDKLEELSFFFDLEMINHLEKVEKKFLYEFLIKKENFFQNKGNNIEKNYFKRILKKVY